MTDPRFVAMVGFAIGPIIDPCVTACALAIDTTVAAHPDKSPNAIRMTVIDVLAASVIRAVAKANRKGLTVGEIIDMHTNHVIELLQVLEQQEAEEEHNRG